MKKIITLLITIFAISSISNAQQYIHFPDSNAIWTQIYTVNSPYSFGRYEYGMIGDTIINTTVYHKIYQRSVVGNSDTTITPANSTFVGAITEDSLKRVYFIQFDNHFNCTTNINLKLYDFSKQIGDTIFLDTLQPECSTYPYMVVDSIDSVFSYNGYLKRFHLNRDTWIEGIGSTRSLFSSIEAYTTCICWEESVCFKQNGITIYMNPYYNTCYPPFSNNIPPDGIKSYKRTEITIYPNPAKDNITIETNTINTENRLEILNMIGQTVYTSNIINKKTTVNT